MNMDSKSLLIQFYTEIHNILKETATNITEVWWEIPEIAFLNQFSKPELRDFLSNFNFISLQRGNYQNYVVINKILFITDTINILKLDIKSISEILNYKII